MAKETASTAVATRPGSDHAVQQQQEVSGLVHLAIERGVDVQVLERLVALQERVTERNARTAFFEALAAFQDEVPSIPKSKTAKITSKRTGVGFSYSYAPLEEIAKRIRPALTKHGLSYHWDTPTVEGGVMQVCCVLRHVEGHAERSCFPVPIDSGGERMSAAQASGAALTYGKRQSLVNVTGLTTVDSDTDAAQEDSDPSVISDAQLADLRALMKEVGQDEGRFLKWARVDGLAKLPASRFGEAVAVLEEKRRRHA